MWTSAILILKQSLGFIQRNGKILLTVLLTGLVVGFAAWHIKPDAPGTITTITVDTSAIVRHVIDSTRLAVKGELQSQVDYWRKRVITRIVNGEPVITTVVDSGGYTLAQIYQENYEYASYQLDSLQSVIASHKCRTAPVSGYKFGVNFGTGTAFNKHSTSFNIGPSIGGDKGVISLSAGYHPWDSDKWRGKLDYIRWFR